MSENNRQLIHLMGTQDRLIAMHDEIEAICRRFVAAALPPQPDSIKTIKNCLGYLQDAVHEAIEREDSK